MQSGGASGHTTIALRSSSAGSRNHSDDEVAARGDEGHAFKVAEKIRAERHDAFYGPPPVPSSLLSVTHAPKDALWIPYAGFPINWKTARIVRKFVEAYHRDETADVANRLKALGTVPEDHPEARRLAALQRELSIYQSKMSNAFRPTISGLAKDYDSPPVEVKTQILAFLEDLQMNGMPSSKERTYLHLRLPLVLQQWLATAAIHGAEGALTDPDGAALVPPDVVSALAHRHTARKHQMLGEGEVVQQAADVMKDRYVLLFQLGPDPAMDWTRGEMGPLQDRLTPEDLAARQFQNTVRTIEPVLMSCEPACRSRVNPLQLVRGGLRLVAIAALNPSRRATPGHRNTGCCLRPVAASFSSRPARSSRMVPGDLVRREPEEASGVVVEDVALLRRRQEGG